MKLWKEKGIYFIDEYYPYWIIDSNKQKIKNDYFNKGKGEYILKLKNNKNDSIEYYTNKLKSILLYKIKNINEFDIITYVPSSKTDKDNLALEKILKNICNNYNNLKFKKCLIRVQNIDKLSTGGNRDKEIHIKTININNLEEIKDKNIIIIDDVTSTGNSMIACKEKLKNYGANKVACLSLSKTYTNLEEAYNDNKYLKLLNKFDSIIQNQIHESSLNKNINDFEEIINSIIENFIFFKRYFMIYDKYIKDGYEMFIRKRELYTYLINQVESLERIEYTLGDIDLSKTLIVKIIIYKTLINENNNLDLLSKYFESVRLFQKQYGYIINLQKFLDNYSDFINMSLSQFETEIYSIDSDLNSMQLNYIAKALYESNTEISLRNALKIIDKAIELDKTEMELYLNRALIYIKLNKFEEVINDIKSSLTLEKKVYSNIIPFNIDKISIMSNKGIIFEWLNELKKINNSADMNYLLALYMYKVYAPRELSEIFNYKNNILTKSESRILELIDIANQKSNNKYEIIMEKDIIQRREINNLDNNKHLKNKNKQYIYHFLKV